MKFKNPYWEPIDKINMLQRWILVHSYIYYELNSSVVSDHMYDNNCNLLVQMKKDYPKAFKKSRYFPAFSQFDGSTGFDLISKLPKKEKDIIERDAMYVHRRWG